MKNDDKSAQQMNIMSIFDAKEIDNPQESEGPKRAQIIDPVADNTDCSPTKLTNATEDSLPGHESRLDFESALAELERVVTELDGEVKLERALELFDQGIKLSGQCERFLKVAEQKVEILKQTSEGVMSVETYRDSAFDASEG